ncbi:MAG: PEP-CTERM sorting domain-containing protein [Verrucomicrobia bacterium]|nr:PEP-CTERM sorting domain-containing protein [Verrucomicrobiota bacterium]
MRLFLLMAFVALMNLGNAANLQLNFDQGTFSGTTTGTFALSGVVPAHGFGSGGYYIGSTYINEYWSFSTQYDNPTGNSFASDFEFNLSGFSATGDSIRNAITYPAFNYGITMWISKNLNLATLQVFIQDQPDPMFDINNYPYGDFTVNMTGSFIATSSAGSGLAPDTKGMTLANLNGTYVNQYDPGVPANALTVSVAGVPEPSTASLLCLTTIPLLFRRRRIS